MPAVEVGRICVKVTGRESGSECVIVDLIDKKFVLITGLNQTSKVRRRRVNIKHIKPTDQRIEIQRGSSDEEIAKLIDVAVGHEDNNDDSGEENISLISD